MKIAVVIGHGGIRNGVLDVGASGNNYTELKWNTQFAEELNRQLKNKNYNSEIIKRTSGITEMISRINNQKFDLIIDCHCNAFANPKVSGCEILYYHKSNNSKRLAQLIATEYDLDDVILKLRHKDGTLARKDTDRGIHILRDTRPPCVTLEPFFITNLNDLQHALQFTEELAASTVKAVEKYFNK